jgi:hypothetical protein
MNFNKYTLLIFVMLLIDNSYASYYGRFISGGFFSKEVFRSSELDRYNDVAILSERLYVSFDKILDSTEELTLDLRDKDNFFDKLNNERVKLTNRNKLQLHQLNLHSSGNNEGVNYSIGRFPVIESGAIFVDGIDLGVRKTVFGVSTKYSLFYGLNPQLVDETEITFKTDSRVYGGYLVVEDKGKDWGNYFYSASSVVRQEYKSDVDRFYFFNNTNLQATNGNNFSSILYLDLLPKVNVQNLWTTYITTLKNKYKLRSSLSTIDSLHYTRIQDVREVLPTSRYHQASFALRSPSTYNSTSLETKLTSGFREVDKKSLVELKFGAFFPQVINDDVSGTLNTGVRKNFISNDFIFGGGFIHSTKSRELSFSQDVQIEKRQNLPMNYAFITEGGYTRFFSRSFFGIVSVQNTWDSSVSIFSILFKLSYRFGEGGQAPMRDGSPPMGQL